MHFRISPEIGCEKCIRLRERLQNAGHSTVSPENGSRMRATAPFKPGGVVGGERVAVGGGGGAAITGGVGVDVGVGVKVWAGIGVGMR